MQNKANFRKVKFDVNRVLTMDYDQLDTWSIRITKPIKANKSQLKPIKPNLSCRSLWRSRNKAKFKKAKMNVTSILTVDYENNPPIRAPKKQSQTSKRQKPMQPVLPQRIMKKTAHSASGKTKPNKPNSMLLKIALSLSRSLRYNECVMKNILLRYKKHGNTD
jgi:hypothetical protein